MSWRIREMMRCASIPHHALPSHIRHHTREIHIIMHIHMPLGILAVMAAIAGTPAAQAAARHPSGSKSISGGKTSSTVKIKEHRGHAGETPAERDKRLYRECRGLPNAGACSGYTRR
ncbi:MAG: hypothetical protein LBE61_16185 [Burkholderiaceae bacterium]|jgi:hypothetical protein|nr:hypothetical protein [Burkholderiaceae bacterium]